MNQITYRTLIAGEAKGMKAKALRFLLSAASIPYGLAVRCRNFLYDKGILKASRVAGVVISVGNITAGGTGKTPLVIWLAGFLEQKGIPCVILTRGYKAAAKKTQNSAHLDEPVLIAQKCPRTKVVVNPDRIAGARQATSSLAKNLFICDDAFQHRKLARDIDIVTIDATCPFGYNRLLPAGLLREPLSGLRRAHAAVITRSNQVTKKQLTQIENKLRHINKHLIMARAIHAPVNIRMFDGKTLNVSELSGRKVLAFCGIGNPQAFSNTLKELAADVVALKVFADHHHYTPDDLRDILNDAAKANADFVISTEKDLTRIANNKTIDIPQEEGRKLGFLEVELRFSLNEAELKRLIEDALRGTILPK